MADKKQKLELTWIGKGDEPRLEPRILIEDPGKSYGDPKSENMLIHGDNLLALKALEQDFAGKIKCIYIDPPYNTGSAFEHYDDNVEHSTWLNLMKPRLELLRSLLREDGVIFAQIDDNEQAYLKVLLDEVFGRESFVNSICVTMSNLSGPKIRHARTGKRFPKIKEYVLIYAKSPQKYKLTIPKSNKTEWDKEYNLIVPEITPMISGRMGELIENQEIDLLNTLVSEFSLQSLNEYLKRNEVVDVDNWLIENSYRICGSKPNGSLASRLKGAKFPDQPLYYVKNATGDLKLIRTDYNKETDTPRIELLFAEETQSVFFGDIWLDIATTGGIAQEGNVSFPQSKKPEKLVSRIIAAGSEKGDYVLDSFLGSGTTSAVAHKMQRKWIGIELGEHANSHASPRLKAVIDGTDQTGVSKQYSWNGGGGFKFYNLAPSLLKKDKHGNWVIEEKYNSNMLAAAMAKQEGFHFNPDEQVYWKQARSTEKDFLFTTTQFLTLEMLDAIRDEMQPEESLLIACKAYHDDCDGKYANISIKKIPQILLGRCEFGKDDYGLNIVNAPISDEDIEADDPEEEMSKAKKGRKKKETAQLELLS